MLSGYVTPEGALIKVAGKVKETDLQATPCLSASRCCLSPVMVAMSPSLSTAMPLDHNPAQVPAGAAMRLRLAEHQMTWDCVMQVAENVKQTKSEPTACPPCQQMLPVPCHGGHVTFFQHCNVAGPFSCSKACGQPSKCGNHTCAASCHPLDVSIPEHWLWLATCMVSSNAHRTSECPRNCGSLPSSYSSLHGICLRCMHYGVQNASIHLPQHALKICLVSVLHVEGKMTQAAHPGASWARACSLKARQTFLKGTPHPPPRLLST